MRMLAAGRRDRVVALALAAITLLALVVSFAVPRVSDHAVEH